MQFARAAKENKDLNQALGRVVMFKANVSEEAGEKLADSYGAHGIPQFFVMDKDGKALDRWRGYGQPSDWLAQYEAALTDLTPVEQKLERYAQAPTEALAAAAGRIRAAEGKRREAVDCFKTAQKLAARPNSRYAHAVFQNAYGGRTEEGFTREDVKAAADALFAVEPPDDYHRARVGAAMADYALEQKDASLLTAYFAKAVDAADRLGGEDGKEAKADLKVAAALLVKKDPKEAFQVKLESLASDWQSDPKALNEVAWWCFEHDIALEDGEKMARLAVTLAKDDESRAETLDTLAEIRNKRGDPKEALELTTRAAGLDPGSEHYKEQIVRFREIVTKKQQI